MKLCLIQEPVIWSQLSRGWQGRRDRPCLNQMNLFTCKPTMTCRIIKEIKYNHVDYLHANLQKKKKSNPAGSLMWCHAMPPMWVGWLKDGPAEEVDLEFIEHVLPAAHVVSFHQHGLWFQAWHLKEEKRGVWRNRCPRKTFQAQKSSMLTDQSFIWAYSPLVVKTQ